MVVDRLTIDNTDTDMDLAGITPQANMEAYAEALRAWSGDPADLYPRLDKKEAKGAVVSFRLPESFERQLDRLVQLSRERGLPWSSRTDFVRDATVWFAEVIASRLDLTDPLLQSLQAGRDISDRLEMMNNARLKAESAVKSLVLLLTNLLSSSRDDDAKREFRRFRDSVRAMPEPYIRRQYELAMDANSQFRDFVSTLEVPAA